MVLPLVAIGGNRPLRKEQMFWTSDGPINEAQLLQMRQEFWDTSPSFEGKKEVWEALRGACEAVEQGDYELAQAIIDGVGVTLPNGTGSYVCIDPLYTVVEYVLHGSHFAQRMVLIRLNMKFSQVIKSLRCNLSSLW